MDFAKKVAVPAVSDFRGLATVLQQSNAFDPDQVKTAVNRVMEQTGQDLAGIRCENRLGLHLRGQGRWCGICCGNIL